MLRRQDPGATAATAEFERDVDAQGLGLPPPLQGAVRNGPAFRQFFLVQAGWFHRHLLLRNSRRLQEDEGVKEKERQVSVLRRSAQRSRGRAEPSTRPARAREGNRIGRYSQRNVAGGLDLNLPAERSFCVSLSLRQRDPDRTFADIGNEDPKLNLTVH